MSGDFIDSNVIIYMFDETDERKREIADGIVEAAMRDHSATISFQVVQETLNVMTRELPSPMSAEDAGRFLETTLAPLWKVSPSLSLYRRGMGIQSRYQYSFYDSLIIAAALDAGCSRLYSEDFQHGQRIESLVIENPFFEL